MLRLFDFSSRMTAIAAIATSAYSTLVAAQGLPGIGDLLGRGYRIVAVVPDGDRHVVYLHRHAKGDGSLVICFVRKNERGQFNAQNQGCDPLLNYKPNLGTY